MTTVQQYNEAVEGRARANRLLEQAMQEMAKLEARIAKLESRYKGARQWLDRTTARIAELEAVREAACKVRTIWHEGCDAGLALAEMDLDVALAAVENDVTP